MGNFHCIPESCSRVVYREYLPPVLRYRYPDEDWQNIDGDSYSIDSQVGKCPTKYHVFGTYISKRNNDCNQQIYWRTASAVDGANVSDYQPVVTPGYYFAIIGNDGTQYGIRELRADLWQNRYLRDERAISIFEVGAASACQNTNSSVGHSPSVSAILRQDRQPDDCGDCEFKVYKQGQLILEEIRDVCPEVEQLPCRLADVSKEIKIEKLPYLERIEVVPYAYSSYRDLGVPAPIVQADEIPAECLNIYNNNVLTFLAYNRDNPESALRDDATPFNSFVAQICSSAGCPPPEYSVICDCQVECPDGTCGVRCGSNICCYGSDGVAVKSIPLDSVFPSGSAEGGDIR